MFQSIYVGEKWIYVVVFIFLSVLIGVAANVVRASHARWNTGTKSAILRYEIVILKTMVFVLKIYLKSNII